METSTVANPAVPIFKNPAPVWPSIAATTSFMRRL
jgi:hypothetical protein